METTAFGIAQRFLGIKEIPGPESHPLIKFAHNLATSDNPNAVAPANDDETSWCGAITHVPAWILRLVRPKGPLARLARAWMTVGVPVLLEEAVVGFDVVILSRGPAPQPGPEVINAAGHVGWFGGFIDFGTDHAKVRLLGGNQSNEMSLAAFPVSRILMIVRLVPK